MHTGKQLSIVAVLVLSACGSGGSQHFPPRPPDPQIHSSFVLQSPSSPASPQASADPLTGIESAAPPPGVDPELWQQLTAALAQAVHARQARPAMQPELFALDNRSASFTPYGTQNMVRDLQLSGSGPWLLSWTYRNSGDYDLNGSVTISDLTPVGQNFGMRESDALWFLALHADGDGNGEINISDVTPIGQNFGGTIVGYRVLGTNDLAGEWTHLGNATVVTNLHRNADRLRFVILLESLDYANYALWPYDNSDDEGGWSNFAAPGSTPQRHIAGVRNYWSR